MHPASNAKSAIFILALSSLLSATVARNHGCTNIFLKSIEGKHYIHCQRLATLGAELAWSHQNNQNSFTVDLIFGAKMHSTAGGWIACGVNPENVPQMVGTRAVIGIKHPDDASLSCNTYNITKYTKMGCKLKPMKIDEIVNRTFEYVDSSGYYILQMKLNLPKETYDISRLSIVWQIGFEVEGDDQPKMHPVTLQHVDSSETLSLDSAKTHTIGYHRRQLRMVHGILNVGGWGTILPLGVIIARYLKQLKRKPLLWYYLHVACQITGYTIGTVGWAIGIWLGNLSTYYVFSTHRLLGIVIFTFTSLQMLALFIKPNKRRDQRNRYWSMCHHFLGYGLLVLISINIFQGIDILKPDTRYWRCTYISIIVFLAFIILVLEVYTWATFFEDRASENKNKPTQPTVSIRHSYTSAESSNLPITSSSS